MYVCIKGIKIASILIIRTGICTFTLWPWTFGDFRFTELFAIFIFLVFELNDCLWHFVWSNVNVTLMDRKKCLRACFPGKHIIDYFHWQLLLPTFPLCNSITPSMLHFVSSIIFTFTVVFSSSLSLSHPIFISFHLLSHQKEHYYYPKDQMDEGGR